MGGDEGRLPEVRADVRGIPVGGLKWHCLLKSSSESLTELPGKSPAWQLEGRE